MIDVFEKMAPSYKKLVRRYALDIWKGRFTTEKREEFFKKANNYKKRYERELVEYYKENDIKIFHGTIKAKGNAWLVDQGNLIDSIKVISEAKKNKLTSDLFDELKTDQSGDVQRMINKIYLDKDSINRGESVYKVFSFADNLEKRAEQLGEENAFELGKDINHAVLSEQSDRYEWTSQEDKRVRKTHQKLNGKTFLYVSPPTTVDKYGNTHTGHCGTDYGCRCYEIPSKKKPKLNYVVYG